MADDQQQLICTSLLDCLGNLGLSKTFSSDSYSGVSFVHHTSTTRVDSGGGVHTGPLESFFLSTKPSSYTPFQCSSSIAGSVGDYASSSAIAPSNHAFLCLNTESQKVGADFVSFIDEAKNLPHGGCMSTSSLICHEGTPPRDVVQIMTTAIMQTTPKKRTRNTEADRAKKYKEITWQPVRPAGEKEKKLKHPAVCDM